MSERFVRVPTASLRANPANVRENLGDLTELADSLRQVGLLQPLVVSLNPTGPATVIDGHRRLAAARIAGLEVLPCLVVEPQGRPQTLVLMLAAAMHRQLTPVEQADAFTRLTELGMTRKEIARSTGYSTATVDNRLLIAGLPNEAQELLTDKRLTIAAATDLARQVRNKRGGEVRTAVAKDAWFSPGHPLHNEAKRRCTPSHGDRYRRMAGACGPCWEAAIRASSVLEVAL